MQNYHHIRVSSFIGLAYEGISSFSHHKQNNALHKAVNTMDNKANIRNSKLMKIRKFDVNIWCLQCRDTREIN